MHIDLLFCIHPSDLIDLTLSFSVHSYIFDRNWRKRLERNFVMLSQLLSLHHFLKNKKDLLQYRVLETSWPFLPPACLPPSSKPRCPVLCLEHEWFEQEREGKS